MVAKLKAAVIGSGSWGTAMAAHLVECGHEVTLWGKDKAVLQTIETSRENPRYLKGVKLPSTLRVCEDLEKTLRDSEFLFISVPTQAIRQVFDPVKALLSKKVVVNTSKGIELDSLKCISDIFEELCPDVSYAVLSGPSFALEVAKKLPTAVTVASRDLKLSETLQRSVANAYFRVYTSQDVVGVELGGALKNVIAVAAGIVVGLRLGYNAQAALINRGIAEMSRLGRARGALLLTFLGLSGMGDLILTCTGPLSRNRRFGEALGSGIAMEQIQKDLVGVAEGHHTAKSAWELAKRLSVNVPITEQVCQILYEGKTPQRALTELMSRDLKEEWG